MKRVLAIVGPTGVGKSALALKLAGEFDGEIVSADSRQIYRFLDIGTAKPTPAEQVLVRHYLIDILNPDAAFSLADYQALAYKTIVDITSGGHLPILAGGSGLYVWAVLEGWQIPAVAPDLELRKRLEERAARGEADSLYRELKELDSEAALRIDPRNVRRVIRALEIQQKPNDAGHGVKIPPPFDCLIIGLTANRETLYQRIDERVDAMVSRGLVEEIQALADKGYGLDLPSMSGIGYRQIGNYLKGQISLEEAIRQVKNESHRYVRQQYNWFSLKDDRIHWFDVDEDPYAGIKALAVEFMKKQV